MNILENLQHRYATKVFDNKKISGEELKKVIEILKLCPSSFGIQPRKFLIIWNQDIKTSLVEHSRWQRQVKDCSHFIVLCARKEIDDDYIRKYTKLLEKERWKWNDEIREERLKIWKIERIKKCFSDSKASEKEVFLALWFLLASLAQMNIDSCPMWWINPEKYDEISNLTNTEYKTVVCCALWYRSPEDKYWKLKKVRFDKWDIIEIL